MGYPPADLITAQLAVDAVAHAIVRRGAMKGCVVRADGGSRGSIYLVNSEESAHALARFALIVSAGRVDSAADNAAAESFFRLLQRNALTQTGLPANSCV